MSNEDLLSCLSPRGPEPVRHNADDDDDDEEEEEEEDGPPVDGRGTFHGRSDRGSSSGRKILTRKLAIKWRHVHSKSSGEDW